MQRRQMTVGRPKTKRQLREYVCGRKRSHPTKQAAIWEMDHLKGIPGVRDPDRLDVYRCGFCVGWHVGHRPKGKD